MAQVLDPPAAPRRGRPKRTPMYKTKAEKQRAYRERQKMKLALLAANQPTVQAALAPAPEKPKTGREMLQALRANGFVGAWAERQDIGDTVEFARQLRERTWARGRA